MTGCYTLPMLVAFDIGGTRIRAARSPAPGLVEPFAEWPTPIRDFDALSDCLKQALSQAGGTAAALSLAGVFDPVTGRARVANIPCIDGRNLSADLQARLNLPVRIANDADCFALAEALSGVGRGHHTVFGIILGTGTGGGLVIDGRLHPGFGGAAGEWGHGPVLRTRADNEPTDIPHWPCGCGLSGCLDTLAGARGLERLDRLWLCQGRGSSDRRGTCPCVEDGHCRGLITRKHQRVAVPKRASGRGPHFGRFWRAMMRTVHCQDQLGRGDQPFLQGRPAGG